MTGYLYANIKNTGNKTEEMDLMVAVIP